MPPTRWLPPTVRRIGSWRATTIYVDVVGGERPIPVGVTVMCDPDAPEEFTPAVWAKIEGAVWEIVAQGPVRERLVRTADAVRAADEAGTSRVKAVAAALGIAPTSASNYIAQARDAGLLD